MSKEWVEYLKERVTLHQVLDYYNIDQNLPGSEETQYKCPFHSLGGDSKPSARIYENGTAYCWGCGKAYDFISFVREYEGLGFKSTLYRIEKMFNVPHYFEDPKVLATPPIDRIQKIFEHNSDVLQEKDIDIPYKFDALNRSLILNKSVFDLETYLKYCVVLDQLEYNYHKSRISESELIKILSVIKDKIIERAN